MAGEPPKIYDVYTELPPESLTAAGISIMEKWVAFALGFYDIAGHHVMNPTGRMASSIRLEQRSPSLVAVIADAEEAEILETGHRAIDLKESMGGRVVPFHRGKGGPSLPALFGGSGKRTWAEIRSAQFSGFARVPSEITPQNARSWIIPAMAAWTPAAHLADTMRDELNQGS